MRFFPKWLDRFSKDVELYNRSVNLSNTLKKMINAMKFVYLCIIKPIEGFDHPDVIKMKVIKKRDYGGIW